MGFTPLKEIYGDTCYFGDYDRLLKSFNYNILIQVDDKDYQGDSRLLFHDKEKDRYGFLTFGWGSCSGCDALEACNSLQDVELLRTQLANSISWFDTAMGAYLYALEKDWDLTFTSQPETSQFAERCVAGLRGIVLEELGLTSEEGLYIV